MKKTQLIVMLTHHDLTVPDAEAVFESCIDTEAKFWGMKEKGLPLADAKRLFAKMKECGKTTVLEVVAYTEAEGIEGAKMAIDCGVDILMGTMYHDSINRLCREHGIRYMPFVGEITGRPSVLLGDIDKMIAEGRDYISRGAYGIDLLGYRYTGDAVELNRRFVAEVGGRVCLAGSVDSFRRLDEVKEAAPEFFTIGSAFFEHKFGDSIAEQINRVCQYIS